MSDFLRLAAYAFLALMGLSAWSTHTDGWRYYFGIILFFVCIMRILAIIRQRITVQRRSNADTDNPAQQEIQSNGDRPDRSEHTKS